MSVPFATSVMQEQSASSFLRKMRKCGNLLPRLARAGFVCYTLERCDMPKEMNEKNLSVFSDVIMSLASDAAAEVDGVEVLRSKDRSKRAIRGGGVSVYFLPNDKVAVDVYVNVNFPCRVPETVAAVQQRVKEEIEGATRFRVHSVNVQVVSVLFPAQN